MSALPRQPDYPVSSGLRMTAEECLALGQTLDRYELIDGVVCSSPSPTPLHQNIKAMLAGQLLASGVPVHVFEGTDVLFDRGLVYCPDIAVYAKARMAELPGQLSQPPDLVIEILSPSNRSLDLVTKKPDSERFGVAEYWVIDPDPRTARVWRAEAGRFVEHPAMGPTIESALIPGLKIELGPIRAIRTARRPGHAGAAVSRPTPPSPCSSGTPRWS